MKKTHWTIKITDQNVPADKSVDTNEDVFRTARQIVYNFHTIILKKDPKTFYGKKNYKARLLK